MVSDPPRTELDKILGEFLAQQSEDKQKGFTIANLFLKFEQLSRRQRDLEGRMRTSEENAKDSKDRIEEAHDRLDAHRSAIVGIKRVTRRSSPSGEFDLELDTGTFDLAAIQREVKENREKRMLSERVKAENLTWWKRHAITVISAAIASIVLSLLAVIMTMAIQSIRAPMSTPTMSAPK